MVDMGQADRTLYHNDRAELRMVWGRCLFIAAQRMGYDHFLDVPSTRDEELRQRAHRLREGVDNILAFG